MSTKKRAIKKLPPFLQPRGLTLDFKAWGNSGISGLYLYRMMFSLKKNRLTATDRGHFKQLNFKTNV